MSASMSSARMAGLVAAAVLALIIIAMLWAATTSPGIVVPTNGVTAGGPADNPGGTADLGLLTRRTTLQEWPGDTAQVPAVAGRGQAAGGPELEAEPTGSELVRQWTADEAQNRYILDRPEFLQGIATIPGMERGVLMQPQGRTWREFHKQVFWGGGFYLFGVSLLLALFLAWRGRIEIAEGESGQAVERFSPFERANHWMTATSFLLMALTGLVVLYGQSLIRPWLGAGAYGDLAEFSVWAHMTLAVPFVIGVIAMAVLWTRENLPERLDWNWLKHGGGFLRHDGENPPARRFNAGQKLVYWGVALGGLGLLVTGLVLMFPFWWAGYTGMQTAQTLHAVIGLLLIGLIIGHIYIGTIGMQGAFEAMWSGLVDRNWAKEHHSLWYARITSGQSPAVRTASRSVIPAVGTFVAGALIALVLGALMSAVYRELTVGSAVATTRDNPAVHLEAAARDRGS
jgi:formate dehydrogenase subunit gamma